MCPGFLCAADRVTEKNDLVQKPDSILRFQNNLLIFLRPQKKIQKISFHFSFLGPGFHEKVHPFPLEFIIHNNGYPRLH